MCKQNSKSNTLIHHGLGISPKGRHKQKLFLQKKKTQHKIVENLLRSTTSYPRAIIVKPLNVKYV